MVSWINAIYFGAGLVLVQFMHTLHSASTYGQKQVRWLEWNSIFKNYNGRRDPTSDELKELVRPFKKPYRYPWKLPYYQMSPARTKGVYRLFGLHATNLYYSYILSICYGLIAMFAVRGLIDFQQGFTLRSVGQLSLLFLLLFGASHWIIGSGFEIVTLESNIGFNFLMLIALRNEIVEYGTAISALQLVTALIAAPLVFWLTFQYREGNLGYGNFMPAYFIIVPVLYSEFFVLVLGLVYV